MMRFIDPMMKKILVHIDILFMHVRQSQVEEC